MPWRKTCPMLERRRFIEDWLTGDWSVQSLCHAYGIGRTTAYKWLFRFRIGGQNSLGERSRANLTHPNATPDGAVQQIIELRSRYPFWGPRKLKARLERLHPEMNWPASST